MTSQLQNKQKFYKSCSSENNDDITNAVSVTVANDLKLPSIYSVERIRQYYRTQSILKFCKDSSPILLAIRIFKIRKFDHQVETIKTIYNLLKSVQNRFINSPCMIIIKSKEWTFPA